MDPLAVRATAHRRVVSEGAATKADVSKNQGSARSRVDPGGGAARRSNRQASSSSGPVAYVCYICGCQFGSASLFIHLEQCRDKWVARESLKPRQAARPLPPTPPGLEDPSQLPRGGRALAEFNNSMMEVYNNISLYMCPNCGRSFHEEAYQKHERRCTPNNPGGGAAPLPRRSGAAHTQFKPKAAKASKSSTASSPAGSADGPSVSATRQPVVAVSSKHARSSSQQAGGHAQLPRGPVSYVCYLCGCQFGSASLFIHQEHCRAKWVAREALKLKHEARPLPPIPEGLEPSMELPRAGKALEDFNNRMMEVYNNISLYMCPNCGRSFHEEAYAKHKRRCTPENPGGGARPLHRAGSGKLGTNSAASPSDAPASKPAGKSATSTYMPRGPVAYVCYLCGCQFGSASLFIHLEQCREKWTAREALKPRHEERPLPPPPMELNKGMELPSGKALEEFNNAMMEAYNNISLYMCPICGRSFHEEAYKKHARRCTPENPGGGARPLRRGPSVTLASSTLPSAPSSPTHSHNPSTGALEGVTGAGPSEVDLSSNSTGPRVQRPSMFVCYLCGQQYGSRSLTLHVPRCLQRWPREEEPLRPSDRRPPPEAPPELNEPLPTGKAGVDAFNAQMLEIFSDAVLRKCRKCGLAVPRSELPQHVGSIACERRKPASGTGIEGKSGVTVQAESSRGQRASAAMPGSAAGATLRTDADEVPTNAADAASGAPVTVLPHASAVQQPSESATSAAPGPGAAQTYICYLCGQHFGSKSLSVHVAFCRKRWLRQMDRLPACDQRPLPPDPEELAAPLPSSLPDVEAFNARMLALHYQHRQLTSSQQLGSGSQGSVNHSGPDLVRGGAVAPGDRSDSAAAVHAWPTQAGRDGILEAPLPGSDRAKASKPRVRSARLYVCYLCGQQYGSASLKLHIPRCQAQYEMEELKKPTSERRPVPEAPAALGNPLPTTPAAIMAFNEAMLSSYLAHGPQASTAGPLNEKGHGTRARRQVASWGGEQQARGVGIQPERRPRQNSLGHDGPVVEIRMQQAFGEDRLVAAAARQLNIRDFAPGTGAVDSAKPSKRPLMYTCYLCCKQFGSRSLAIHTVQCQKRRAAEQAAQPVPRRRAVPDPPPELGGRLPTLPAEVADFNARMTARFKHLSQQVCMLCGETFTSPAEFDQHEMLCTVSAPTRGTTVAPGAVLGSVTLPGLPAAVTEQPSVEQPGIPGKTTNGVGSVAAAGAVEMHWNQQPLEEDLERLQCGTCSRWFRPEALQKHERVCAQVFQRKRVPMDMSQKRMAGRLE